MSEVLPTSTKRPSAIAHAIAAFLTLQLMCVSAVLAQSVTPATFKLGDLVITAPSVLQPPKGARVAAGYMKITNTGKLPDRFVGGSAPFAQRFEIHEMVMESGVMKMRELTKGLEIKPGETVELKPGGLHIMYLGLTEAPAEGKPVKTKLRFEIAGEIEIDLAVTAAGGSPPAGAHKH